MAHLGVFPLLATIACLAFQPALANQKPEYMCPEFWLTQVFTGFGNECGTVNIKDLKGYAPSQILYDIIAEAPLSNDTFFSNGSHVTCLFQDTSYALSGATIGFPTGLHFQFPKSESDGALCLSLEGVSEGGLNLGEIPNLTRAFVLKGDCSTCGEISAIYLSRNKTKEGYVRIDWATNSVCIGDCIDPSKGDLLPPPPPEKNQTSEEGKKLTVAAMRNGWGTLGSVLLLTAMVAFL